jgi:hypothetical protein
VSQTNFPKSAPANRPVSGPFDATEVADLSVYGDFGSILVQPVAGLDIRLDVEEATGQIMSISMYLENSTLTVQAFAAPKTEGLWHEVRDHLRNSIVAQGGTSEDRLGSFGPELLGQIPEVFNGQVVGRKLARFIGIDGPRWLLRCVVGGAAVTDPAAASRIDGLIRSLVVNRGDSPIPPREVLPLSVPGNVITPPRPGISKA